MKNKIRVLSMIRFPVGGIRTYLKYTYKYLDPEKYQLTFLTVEDPEGEWISRDLAAFSPEVVKVAVDGSLQRLGARAFRLLQEGRFDLIHSHGFTAGMVAALANLPFRVPHLVTPHAMLYPHEFEGLRGAVKRTAMAAMMRTIDCIQPVSRAARENLFHYFPRSNGAHSGVPVILNGVDVQSLENAASAASASLRAGLKLEPGQILFGYLGRFMPEKGFVELIGAVEELSADPAARGRFKVLAVNDGAFIREYKALIERKGLSPHFIFHGFVPDIAPILKQIDALVMPSLSEACSLLPMEAMIVGTAVIASDCAGLREVTQGTPAIEVKAGDPHSLAEGIRRFLREEPSFKEQAAGFAAEARRRFDSRNTASQLDELLTRIASSRRAACAGSPQS